MRRARTVLLLVLLALLLVPSAIALVPTSRRTAMTALLVPQLFPDAPVRPLEWVTRTPIRREVAIPRLGATAPGDLYAPGEGRHGAIILVLGVNPLDRRDPLVVRLGEGLARLGLVALVPESPELTAGRLVPEEVDALVEAFQFLQAQPEVDPTRVGFAGLCVGATLVALAATDPRIADEVALLHLFGPYYSGRELVRAVLSEKQVDATGSYVPWTPSQLARDVVTEEVLRAVSDGQDNFLLRQALARNEPTSGLPLRTHEGQVAGQLLARPSPEVVEALLEQLPRSVLAKLDALSLEGRTGHIRAPVVVMHDRGDPYVPIEQSRRLAAALARPPLLSYEEFELFEHVVPRGAEDPLTLLRESWRLVRAIERSTALLR